MSYGGCMNRIVAFGGQDFILGFELAGVETVEAVNVQEGLLKLVDIPEIGIVITDEKTMSVVDAYVRQELESRIRPILVVLSAESGGEETLRKKIIKSIGVDLWKD